MKNEFTGVKTMGNKIQNPIRLSGSYSQIFELWSLDVWGNAEDGYTVNDRFCVDRKLVIPAYKTLYNKGCVSECTVVESEDKQILQALISCGFLKSNVTMADVVFDGDDIMIYIEDSVDGMPICQLVVVG